MLDIKVVLSGSDNDSTDEAAEDKPVFTQYKLKLTVSKHNKLLEIRRVLSG